MNQRSLNQTLNWLALIIFGLLFGAIQAWIGWQENVRWHFVSAGLLLALALAGIVALWLRSRAARDQRDYDLSLQDAHGPAGRGAGAERGRWLPPASIVSHDGRRLPPDADFFHSPPDRIGEVLSAATTLTESSQSRPTRRLYARYVRFALLGAALLVPTPVWMIYSICRNLDSPLALFFICAGAVVSVLLGAAVLISALLAMHRLRFSHVCSFVGKKGFARYSIQDSRHGQITPTVMLFADATELRTTRTDHNLHGVYVGTGYSFRWTDAAGREHCELAGDYRATADGLPKPGDQFYFGAAAEAAWSEYLLESSASELKRQGSLQFNLEEGRCVRVGPGFLEFSWGSDGPVCVALEEIGELKLDQGQFHIAHKDAGFFSRKGKFHFAYGSMANARLFLLALERLLGYRFRT